MIDHVHYALFGGPLATPVHTMLVRPKLEEIFAHRRTILSEKFPYPSSAAPEA